MMEIYSGADNVSAVLFSLPRVLASDGGIDFFPEFAEFDVWSGAGGDPTNAGALRLSVMEGSESNDFAISSIAAVPEPGLCTLLILSGTLMGLRFLRA